MHNPGFEDCQAGKSLIQVYLGLESYPLLTDQIGRVQEGVFAVERN